MHQDSIGTNHAQRSTHNTQLTTHNTQLTTHSTQHTTGALTHQDTIGTNHAQHSTHNTQHTTHNTQHTTHNTQHTTHSTWHTTGALTHQDTIGTKETLGKGSIQFMTAGVPSSGISLVHFLATTIISQTSLTSNVGTRWKYIVGRLDPVDDRWNALLCSSPACLPLPQLFSQPRAGRPLGIGV